MFCENCGKQLIRGYQFCMECGTPVPPEEPEQEEEINDGDMKQENPMPNVEPINNDSGSLVFCPTCGMHMQTSTTVCEKCGIALSKNNSGGMPATNAVPLWNENPGSIGDEFGGMSDGEIEQINSFMSGGGIEPSYSGMEAYPSTSSGDMDAIGGASSDEIEALTQQLANFGASASEMPAIGIPAPSGSVHKQQEPAPGEAREVENFSMDTGDDFDIPLSDGKEPVIEGESMEENPAADVSLDPYSFVNNILEGTEPVHIEPENPQPVYTEPVYSEPVYANPRPETEETPDILAGVDVESDYVPEEIASTEEPADAPAYEEAAAYNAPAFEEEADETPDILAGFDVESDYVPEEIASAEEPADAPAYEEAAAYNAPAFEEDEADETPDILAGVDVESDYVPEEIASAEEPADAPAYEEAADDIVPAFDEAETAEEPAPEANNIPVEPIYTPEPAPAPRPAPAPASDELPAEDPVLGKLVYCRNCGQDMYEKEPTCKNCGAPYKGAYVPPKHRATAPKKEPFKLFGVFSIPSLIGTGVLLVAVIALVVTTKTAPQKPPVGGNKPVSTTSSTADTTPSEPDSTPSESEVTEPAATTTTSAKNEDTTPASSTSNQPDESSVPEAATTPEPASSDVPSTTSSATSRPVTSSTSRTPATTTTRPVTTTTTKPITTTTKKPVVAGPSSAKITSIEKDRDKIMDAASLIAGEVGKLDMFAQNVIYAMDNASGSTDAARSSFYNRDLAKNLLSSIESGKTAVDSAVSKAKPANSELNTAYSQLTSLQKKYNAYYNFIKSPSGNTGTFSNTCANHLSECTSILKSGLKYSKIITSSYTSGDTNIAYSAALSDAVTAANNAISAFNTLHSKLTALSKSSFDNSVVQELSKSSVSKAYANAACYAQQVHAYAEMLSGAPADYSGAYSKLTSLSNELVELIDLYNMIQENDYSSYKNSSSTGISNAKSYASAITNAIS